jgi:mono/diheme cytochrome c family protein
MRRADRIAGLLVAAGLLTAAAPSASGADAERGRQLYELHCGGCHYERVHQRERWRSRIKTTAALRVEVARWAKETGRPFRAEDVDDIAEYLDRSHYRLAK